MRLPPTVNGHKVANLTPSDSQVALTWNRSPERIEMSR